MLTVSLLNLEVLTCDVMHITFLWDVHHVLCMHVCIMYADDLLLMSACVLDLQKMLDTCGDVGLSLGINFNAKKSLCILIGPTKCATLEPMLINKYKIQWTDKIHYLGVTLRSANSFSINLADSCRKFFINTML